MSETVASIVEMHTRAQAERSSHQQRVERVMAALARPGTLYAIVGSVAVWIVANETMIHANVAPLDPPPFFSLQGVLALASLLTTTSVLITQNRQTRHAEQRSRLDLQVNLLAEAKVAKLIALIEELRRDLPSVPNRVDRVADAMQQTIDPAKALAALEKTLKEKTSKSGGGDEGHGP